MPCQLNLFPTAAAVADGLTVRQYAGRWLATHSAPPFVRPYTQRLRGDCLGAYVYPTLGDRALASITVADLTSLQMALIGRGMKISSVRTIISGVLGPLLAAALREGVIERLPGRLRWPRRDWREPDPYLPGEVDRILDWFAAHDPARHAFVALVFLAGLRPSEAAALRWRDIDLPRGAVRIDKSLVDGVVSPTKTARSTRTILASAQLAAILRHRAGDPASLVVTARSGRPLPAHRFGGREMRKCCDALGIRHRALYAGRRAYLSAAASGGANLTHLARYSGSSVRMLEQHYVRYLGELSDPMPKRTRRSRP